jgi:hypothetical protein
MSRRLSVVAMLLGGCSFAFQPHASLRPDARKPTAAPVAADIVLTAATLGLAAAASGAQCTDNVDGTTSTGNCWGLNYLAAGALVAAAIPFAVSAIYGSGQLGWQHKLEHEQLARPAHAELAAPGLVVPTPTCQQRREAILAEARLAVHATGHAVAVRDLPECGEP